MICKAELMELDKIMDIIDQAKRYLKEKEIDQWQDGYPNREVIYDDILKGQSYVLKHEDVIGTMVLMLQDDPDYKRIDGQWMCQGKYGVIHRIAIDDNHKGKGVAKEFLEFAARQCEENQFESIRIDTHKKNLSMRRFLEKNGFEECGIIYIHGVSPRIAYEKRIKKGTD